MRLNPLTSRLTDLVDQRKAEGFLTSGDICSVLGISRPYVKTALGEPCLRVKSNGLLINLWHKDKVGQKVSEFESKLSGVKLPRRY